MNIPIEKKKRIKVYVVQGDARDHHGNIVMVTRDYSKAINHCKRLILSWNRTDKNVIDIIREDAANMTTLDFIDKYSGNAWVTAPVLTWYFV